MTKSAEAFRTISEVAEWLETPTHVLRFWESKFDQIKPVKRSGGRRYYRPKDMLLIGGIKQMLHVDGLTIKGAQKVLKEHGIKHVTALSQPLDFAEQELDPNSQAEEQVEWIDAKDLNDSAHPSQNIDQDVSQAAEQQDILTSPVSETVIEPADTELNLGDVAQASEQSVTSDDQQQAETPSDRLTEDQIAQDTEDDGAILEGILPSFAGNTADGRGALKEGAEDHTLQEEGTLDQDEAPVRKLDWDAIPAQTLNKFNNQNEFEAPEGREDAPTLSDLTSLGLFKDAPKGPNLTMNTPTLKIAAREGKAANETETHAEQMRDTQAEAVKKRIVKSKPQVDEQPTLNFWSTTEQDNLETRGENKPSAPNSEAQTPQQSTKKEVVSPNFTSLLKRLSELTPLNQAQLEKLQPFAEDLKNLQNRLHAK